MKKNMRSSLALMVLLTAGIAASLTSCTKKEKAAEEETPVEEVSFYELLKTSSEGDNIEKIKAALENGQDVNQKDENGFAPIFYAIVNDPKAAEDALLSLTEEIKNENDSAAFQNIQTLTSLESSSQLFALLEEKGADLTVTSPAGKNLFSYAALRCEDTNLLEKLLPKENFNQEDFTFALFLNTNPECIKLLLPHYDLNAKDENGIKPIMWACMYQTNTAVIDALIAAGADINDKSSKENYSPLDWAARCNRNEEIYKYVKETGGKSTKKKNNVAENKEFPKLQAQKVFIAASTNEIELKRFLAEATRYRGTPGSLAEVTELYEKLEDKETYDATYQTFLEDDGSLGFNQNHRLFTYDEIVEMLTFFKKEVFFGKNTSYIVLGANTTPQTFYQNGQFKIRYGLNSYKLIANENYDPWAEALDLTKLNDRTSDYYYYVDGVKNYYSSRFTEFYSEGFVFLYELSSGKIYSDFGYSNVENE